MKKIINIVVILFVIYLLLIGCNKEQSNKKYYLVEGRSIDWYLKDCIIRVQNGELLFQGGKLSIDTKVDYLEISIFQDEENNNTNNIIFAESYSTNGSAKLNKEFKDIKIENKNIDIKSKLKVNVITKNGTKGNKERVDKLLVKEIESNSLKP